ncbi:type VI secretion system tip protein TssI/VgrG [Polyangium sp. 6x1]|uniref:type VI secretion system tip protein TssI/VgrG n=1 Tax=Polyangium sp. 6x1 TaxID=3042689 RepID=UPI002482C486|nr:type VI secretion system tip protein TssI/VgrG [Polyangium sp. 6x1]MDI1449968.1 type VI secretion system tip protein TssI/VgrG [Polyangium sp. 6x1]
MENLELRFAAKDINLSVRSFSVVEEMSTLFDVSLVARSADEDIDLDALVGNGAGFKVAGGLAWTGVVQYAEQIEVEPDGLSTYFLRIVPALWRTSQRRNQRIFQHISIPDITKKLLADWEIEPLFELDAATFPKLEYRVQYGETDFAFLSRLFEEAGISYHFRPPDPGSEAPSRLVLITDPTVREAGAPLLYVNNLEHAKSRDAITHVKVSHQVRQGRMTLRDHDFRRRPDFQLIAEAKSTFDQEDRYESYSYVPGAFVVDPGRVDEREAKALASRRLDGARQGRRKVLFQTTALGLSPGDVFCMEGHPRDDLAKENRLLLVQRTLEGTSEGDWSSTGTAVFADDPYRPVPVTPKPRMGGLQSAVVVGPAGEEIHVDEYGRVRVQFHWDREGKYTDESSCWIRVSQVWAGRGYGNVAIPRVGQEVLVDFLEGDPDQPIIVGRVFNGTSPHPYKLPDHKTKTSWKSDSSPGSGGFNEITFEDAKGREKVFMHAQKDREEVVREKHTLQVGTDLDVQVGERESRKVGADQTLHVVGSRTTRVEQSDVLVVGGECHIQVGETGASLSNDRVVLSTGKASLTIAGGDIFLDASGSIKVSAGGLAGLAGREVHIDGAPNVLLNTAGASSPVPMSLGAAEINLADLSFPEAVNNAAKALQAKLFDEIPGGFDEQAVEGALRRLLEEPPASLADAPGYLLVPEAINEQLKDAIDKVLGVPGMIMDDVLDRVALEQKKLQERIDQIRARAGEIAGDVQEKIRGAVEDLRARAEAAKQMAIAKFEEVRAKLEAAKAQVQAKIQELRGKLEEAKARAVAIVEEFKGKLEAAKAAVLGKVAEVKEKFAEAKARVQAKIDEIKGRIEAVKEQAKAKIEEIKGRINDLKEQAKAKVQEIKERVIALKDQAVERFQEMKKQAGEIIEMAKTQVEAAKARVQELKARIEGAKEEVKQKVQEWKGKVEEWKAQAKAKVEEIKGQAKAVVDEVKGQIESAKETVKQTIADAKEMIADVKAIPKEFVAESKAAWNEIKTDAKESWNQTKAEAKQTWEEAKETWKQTKADAKDTWNQTKADAKQSVEDAKEAWKQTKADAKETWGQTKDEFKQAGQDAKEAWKDIKGDAKDAWGDIKNEAEDFWGDLEGQGKDAAEGTKDALGAAQDQGQGALGDAKSALQNAFGGNGSNALSGPQFNVGQSATPDGGSLGQLFSRAGGFTGDDVASAINGGSKGATILQSPGEGQLFVMKTQSAMPVSGAELEANLVEAQMNGFSSSDAFVHTLTKKGYVVYERPWGELAEAFVKRAAVI